MSDDNSRSVGDYLIGRASRRQLLQAGIGFAGLAIAAACSTGSSATTTTTASPTAGGGKQDFSGVTLNIGCNPTGLEPAKAAAALWHDQTGGTALAVNVPYAERALDFASAIVTKDPHFDVFFASKDFVAKFSDRLYVDLGTLKLDTSDFVPSALHQLSRNGKLYALPLFADQELFIYNKKDFAAAGADPNKPPSTYEGLFALAPKLNSGAREACVTSWQLGTLFYLCYYNSTGNKFLGPDGTEILFDNPDGQEAWRQIAEGFQSKFYGPAGFNSTGDADTAKLFNQDLGSSQIGLTEWWSEAISGNQKDFGTTISKDDVGITTAPGMKAGTHGSVIVAEGFGISKFSKNQAAALSFLQLATSKEFQKKLNLNQVTGGILPSSRLSVSADADVVKAFPIAPIFAEQAKGELQWPGVQYPIDPIFNLAYSNLFKGTWTAQQAHTETVKATKAAIAKYLSS